MEVFLCVHVIILMLEHNKLQRLFFTPEWKSWEVWGCMYITDLSRFFFNLYIPYIQTNLRVLVYVGYISFVCMLCRLWIHCVFFSQKDINTVRCYEVTPLWRQTFIFSHCGLWSSFLLWSDFKKKVKYSSSCVCCNFRIGQWHHFPFIKLMIWYDLHYLHFQHFSFQDCLSSHYFFKSQSVIGSHLYCEPLAIIMQYKFSKLLNI